MNTLKVLSLFSGCGGMDIGFEGGFECLKRSINEHIHKDWIEKDFGKWVVLKDSGFDFINVVKLKSTTKELL